MLSDKRSYEDYKYVMADTAFVYVGAKYTYEELLEADRGGALPDARTGPGYQPGKSFLLYDGL